MPYISQNGVPRGPSGKNGQNGARGPAGYNATGAAADQQTIADYITETAGPTPVRKAISEALGEEFSVPGSPALIASGRQFVRKLAYGAPFADVQGELDDINAREGGGVLQLEDTPVGQEYRLGFAAGEKLAIPANTTLRGLGRSATVLRVPDGAAALNAVVLENDSVTNAVTENPGIVGLTIDGNKAGQASTGGTTALLRLWGASGLNIDDVEVKNGRAGGVTSFGIDNAFTRPGFIGSLWIHDCVGDGLLTSKRNRDIFMAQVFAYANGGRGWYSDQSECHIGKMVTKWNGLAGVEFNNVQRHDIDSIQSSFNGEHGVWFDQFITGAIGQIVAMNNGQKSFDPATGNVTTGLGWADVYLDATSEQSYGISDRFVVGTMVLGGDANRVVEVGPNARDPHLTTEDYGLFVEDGIGQVTTVGGQIYTETYPGRAYQSPGIVIGNVVANDALVKRVRLPDVRGRLHVTGPSVDAWTDITSFAAGASAGAPVPQVRRDDRRVLLEGTITHTGTTANTTIFTLPAWARPTTARTRIVQTNSATVRATINPDGTVSINAAGATTIHLGTMREFDGS